jgi:dipeptidyl aminopeptidase/acylaminoacyl peptidase
MPFLRNLRHAGVAQVLTKEDRAIGRAYVVCLQKDQGRSWLSISCVLFALLSCGFASGQGTSVRPMKRPVTVADCVRMTKLGDPLYYRGASSRGLVAQFSPDGTKFIVVFRKGNIQTNTNEYSILMWRTADVFKRPRPQLLLTMSSSSNRPAIENATWSADNQTIAFLGEEPGRSHQLYVINTSTSAVNKITKSPTNLVGYSMTADGDTFAYTTESPQRSFFDDNAKRQGLVISNQLTSELATDRTGGRYSFDPHPLFLKNRATPAKKLETIGGVFDWYGPPLISPDGRHILVATRLKTIDDDWKEYSDATIHNWATAPLNAGEYSSLQRYELIETATGRTRFLSDAPSGKYWSESAWSPDSRSVVITNQYLSLRHTSSEERALRQSTAFVVEFELSTGSTIPISHEDLKLRNWDRASNWLVFDAGRNDFGTEPKPAVLFRKHGRVWEKTTDDRKTRSHVEIVLEENMHESPKLYAVDLSARGRAMLLDLNPQFANLEFGEVEEVHWSDATGRNIKGGLYFPVAYSPGKKYPLVIQTHAWTPDKFWIDGPWTTAFAAQPLAGQGMMVLQVGLSAGDDWDSARGVAMEVAALESGIDYLNGQGFIDPNRVGIVGFSLTCLHVKYVLTHSRYRFAAASVTDGEDGGYLQYLTSLNCCTEEVEFFEKLNGGSPWGKWPNWVDQSPGFRLDKVQTPLRIVALNTSNSLEGEWEWFAGLRRLGKPVEMVAMKDGAHLLEKPWDRLVSQQGNVDWFAFWLQAEGSTDPSKAAQYERWSKLRNLHSATR